MTSLLNEIRETKRKKNRNKIEIILETLDEADRLDLLAALDDHSLSPTIISRVLKGRGFEVHRSVIQRHRGLYSDS